MRLRIQRRTLTLLALASAPLIGVLIAVGEGDSMGPALAARIDAATQALVAEAYARDNCSPTARTPWPPSPSVWSRSRPWMAPSSTPGSARIPPATWMERSAPLTPPSVAAARERMDATALSSRRGLC